MKKGDKVWTWDHWKKLIKIEIRVIEYEDGMHVVNNQHPIEWCAFEREEARRKLLKHIQNRIEALREEIVRLTEQYADLSSG